MSVSVRFGAGNAERKVHVACLSSDVAGRLMCIRPGGLTETGRWRVTMASNDDRTRAPAVGVLLEKYSPTTGLMLIQGMISGVFSGMDVTKRTFLGANGSLVQSVPVAPQGGYVMFQSFGFPVAPDVLWVTGEIGLVVERTG